MGFDPVGMFKTGKGKKGSAPDAPDFKGAAEATGRANRPDQTTPFASSRWSQGPDGKWSQSVGFNGPLDGMSQNLQGQAANAWSNPLDNGADARKHAEDAIYGRETSRLDPQFQQGEDALRTRLQNQGLAPGSEAFNHEMDAFGRTKNDAYASARNDSIMGGGQEASRQQAMDLQSRMAPMGALFGMKNLSQMPNFMPGPNYLGAAMAQGQYGLDSTQINNQGQADYWSGLTKLGSAAASGGAFG